jgi:hypothetical protein
VSVSTTSGQPAYPFMSFIGNGRPTAAQPAIEIASHGADDLPLSDQVVTVLRTMISQGRAIRVRAQTAADLRLCTLTITFVLDQSPMPAGGLPQ